MPTTIQLQYQVDIAKAESAIDAMKAKLESLRKAQENALNAKNSGDSGAAYDKLTKQIELLEKETTLASAKLGDLSDAARAANLNPLADSAGAAEASLKKLRVTQDALMERIERETDPVALKRLRTEYAANEKQIEKTKNKIGDFQDKLRTLDGSKVERVRASFDLVREGLVNLDFDKVKTGIGGATNAFGGLGKAIVATGIGALIVFVGYLIANFDKLKNFIPGLGAAFEIIGGVINTIKDGILAFTDSIGLTDSKTAAMTEKVLSDRERLNKELDLSEKEAIENARRNGEDTQKVVDEYRNRRIEASEAVIRQLEKQRRRTKVLSDEEKKALQEAKDAIRELNIEAEKEANDRADAEKKAAEERQKEEDQRAQEKRQKAKSAADKLRAEQKAAQEATIKAIADLEVQAIRDKDERDKAAIRLALQRSEQEIAEKKALFKSNSDRDVAARADLDKQLQLLREKAIQDIEGIEALSLERKRQREQQVEMDIAQFNREQQKLSDVTAISNLESRISQEQAIRQRAIQDESDPVKRAQLEIENIRAANAEALQLMRARYDAQIAETRRAQQALLDAERVKLDNVTNDPNATAEQKLAAEEDFTREKAQLIQAGNSQELELNRQLNEALKAQNDKSNQDELDGFNALQQSKIQKAQDTIGQIGQGLQGLNDFTAALGEIESNRLDNEYRKKIQGAAGDANAQEKIQKEFEVKREELRKREFRRNKAFQLMNAAIAGAQAVITSIANGGGVPAGIPFGVAAGVVAAAQIAAIASKQYDGSGGSASVSAPAANMSESSSGAPSVSTAIPMQFAQATSNTQQAATIQSQPARVYVVETDIQTVTDQRERRDSKLTVIN